MAEPMPAHAAPAFTQTGPLSSDAGYFMVEWRSEEPVTLEIAGTGAGSNGAAQPKTLYKGNNTSLFVSGLNDGEYELRLRDKTGASADTLALTVEHQSLSRALWLVALGALAFLAAIAVVVRGPRDA